VKKKSCCIFFSEKTECRLFPQDFQGFSRIKKWIFSGRVFCADSEYILDVASHTNLIWLKKVQQTCFLAKFPKSGKNPPKKFFFLLNQIGFSSF
jgi:hypothetical protein